MACLWRLANTRRSFGSPLEAFRREGTAPRGSRGSDRRAGRIAAGISDRRRAAARSLPPDLRATADIDVRPLHADDAGGPDRGSRGVARSGGAAERVVEAALQRRADATRAGRHVARGRARDRDDALGPRAVLGHQAGRQAAADDQRARRVDRFQACVSRCPRAQALPRPRRRVLRVETCRQAIDAALHPSNAASLRRVRRPVGARADRPRRDP